MYLLAITAAAAAGRRRAVWPEALEEPQLRFVVLVPAHDEEKALPRALRSLAALDYPPALLRIVVVADHCADATAAVARAHGVEVLERRDGARGKGPVLAWALARLAEQRTPYDAILFVDADCVASPNLVAALEQRLRHGAGAAQADNVVANPNESWASALRFAGFALMNTVRPCGKDALGLSSGILGTGFAIDRKVLARLGWHAFSLTEDTEYHVQLLQAGVRVHFVAEASVRSAMPTSLHASRAQHARWESGKVQMVRRWAPRLLLAGMRRRDVRLLHAAIEGLVPPQSALAAAAVTLTVTGRALRSVTVTALAASALVGQVIYVLCGLWLARAPVAVYRALLFAPVLVVWKLRLLLRVAFGRAPGWERTAR